MSVDQIKAGLGALDDEGVFTCPGLLVVEQISYQRAMDTR